MERAIVILFIVLGLVSDALGQPPFPPPPSQAVPLDVVVGILLVGGVFYGLRKLMKTRKRAEA